MTWYDRVNWWHIIGMDPQVGLLTQYSSLPIYTKESEKWWTEVRLYAPNCLDFWHQAKTVQKNWLKLVLCLQILNLDWTTLWNHLNSLPNGHSGVRMVLDLFWTSKPGKCSQKSPKQNSPLILLQNFGTPINFWKSPFFVSF